MLSSQAPLRRRIRQQRRMLSPRVRQHAGRAVMRHMRRYHVWQRAQHVGVYLDDFGEVPTRALLELAHACGKQVYVPVVRAFDQRLQFCPIQRAHWQRVRMARHRLGMLQPQHQRGVSVQQLDLLIVPLVAVDQRGIRLGMGGGFYDRTLAHAYTRPHRVGLGYAFQQVPLLSAQPWDQALDALVTPHKIIRFKRHRATVRARAL